MGRSGTNVPAWAGHALTGPYSVPSGMTSYTVIQPSGAAPSESDLSSHRYHHHTVAALTTNKVWACFSSGGTNEDAGGQMTVACVMDKGGSSFGSPQLVVPAQSTFSGTGASAQDGTRVSMPRCRVTYGGKIYIVAAIDEFVAGSRQGIALVACELKDDGTLGTLFRISWASYTPSGGAAAIDYNATLGPPIYALAKLYGIWGGSQQGASASDWNAFAYQSGDEFTEPFTSDLDGRGQNLVRFWRKASGSNTDKFWSQRSYNGGTIWSTLTITDIPNSPSAGFIGSLQDGRRYILGNPNDAGVSRDPLFLAVYNGTTGAKTGMWAIRQGLNPNPVYAGTNKLGSAAYPGADSDATNLWVIASERGKENVVITKVPVANI